MFLEKKQETYGQDIQNVEKHCLHLLNTNLCAQKYNFSCEVQVNCLASEISIENELKNNEPSFFLSHGDVPELHRGRAEAGHRDTGGQESPQRCPAEQKD